MIGNLLSWVANEFEHSFQPFRRSRELRAPELMAPWSDLGGDSPFCKLSSWEEVEALSSRSPVVLMIGFASWSWPDQQLIQRLNDERSWLVEHQVTVVLFDLEEPEQVRRLCPDYVPFYMKVVTTPSLLIVKEGVLKDVRFGPLDTAQIQRMISEYLPGHES